MNLPLRSDFCDREWQLIKRLNTPAKVQSFLNKLTYNHEAQPQGETLRSFREVLRHQTAHCLEAALFSAVVLEQHGYPSLLMSLESICKLDHVIFVYRHQQRWGAIARSRDPGLHGRLPVFRSARQLAQSYFDPYVDHESCIKGFAVVDLQVELPHYDWRFSPRNRWKVETLLIEYPHHRLPVDWRKRNLLRKRYLAFKARYPDLKPLQYAGRQNWSDLPLEFRRPGYEKDWP